MVSYSMRDSFDFAKKRVGIEGWEGYAWEALEGGCLVTGCVPSGVYSRGPRKGKPKFRPATPGTERRVVVSDADMAQVIEEYEASGTCFRCKGEGKEWCGWSKDDGHRYRECSRCNGVGKVTR